MPCSIYLEVQQSGREHRYIFPNGPRSKNGIILSKRTNSHKNLSSTNQIMFSPTARPRPARRKLVKNLLFWEFYKRLNAIFSPFRCAGYESYDVKVPASNFAERKASISTSEDDRQSGPNKDRRSPSSYRSFPHKHNDTRYKMALIPACKQGHYPSMTRTGIDKRQCLPCPGFRPGWEGNFRTIYTWGFFQRQNPLAAGNGSHSDVLSLSSFVDRYCSNVTCWGIFFYAFPHFCCQWLRVSVKGSNHETWSEQPGSRSSVHVKKGRG